VVYNNIGFTYFNLGDYETAIENYQIALTIQPDYVRAMTNLGNAEAALGKTDAARAAFQRALDIDPQNEAAQQGMERLP
jgi:tetratricopeptide (TPR) repeat protein